MDKINLTLLASTTLVFCVACSEKVERQAYLDNAPVVAKRIAMEQGDLIDFNPELLTDTIVFPLSYFVEEPEIVKLDNRDEALVSPNQQVVVSDNYFLALAWETTPCKLFDKKGRFIANIGGIGNGPGEYNYIRSYHLDEANQRIYLFGGYSEYVNVYDFTGKVLSPIKLPRQLSDCAVTVKNGIIQIVTHPDTEPRAIAWTQTPDGEVLDSIPSGYLAIPEGTWPLHLYTNKQIDPMAVYSMTMPGRTDSLYYVDFERKALIPRFTMDYSKRTMQVHEYEELLGYFVGSTSTEITIVSMNDDGSTERHRQGDKPAFYIIDKETLKGNCFRIENDYLANVDPVLQPTHQFPDGYFIRNMDPGEWAEKFETILKSETLSDNMRRKLTAVLENMGDDDNNYILYAKLRQK